MEVEIDMDQSAVKKVKLDQDAMKPTINSDMSYNDDDDANDDNEDDDGFDFEEEDDDDEYMFEDFKEDNDSHYLSMQAQFDNVDLPPGVEASFSWLNDAPPVTHDQTVPNLPVCKTNDIASSSSSVLPNITSTSKVEKEDATKEEEEEEATKKFEHFKLFDIVNDFSDHHYNGAGFHGQQPPKKWTKKIQDEWKILEKDLPNSIFVRAYETRMDLMRAVIVGPAGTPYHDGLFVFDIHFPPTYPDTPPMVYYYSGGLRLNPNLYDNGKVCLSLLNTWTGKGSEKWVPTNSTMLQVLVSIQALILNDKPFFNEPGYDGMYPGAVGEKRSKEYNEEIFILSLKTMIYTLRRPPKHFEDLVAGHFRSCAHVILSACRAYMEGVQVGSVIDARIPDDDKRGSNSFKAAVGRMVNGLVSNFSRYGATDCDQYRV